MNSHKKYVLSQYVFKNPAELSYGLMNKPTPLFENTVAIFIFNESGPKSMWMKNTYSPLDMIFLDKEKKVLCIKNNAKPLNEETIPCNDNVKYVLEANVGYIKKNNIIIGDTIIFANYE